MSSFAEAGVLLTTTLLHFLQIFITKTFGLNPGFRVRSKKKSGPACWAKSLAARATPRAGKFAVRGTG